MENNIIDNPMKLILLSEDELEEILIEKYNNQALLRELLRQTLADLRKTRRLADVYKEQCSQYINKVKSIKEDLEKFTESINQI
ncbi:MAG: hypothetical protein K0R54_1833 [Clostridiaceae bacterium]|jgi:FlaA1/EpsC-like NDP-sugar epimerase|nr:hypothetical protein [Clostridiaceae bacterium]